jgi:hypothetical protein
MSAAHPDRVSVTHLTDIGAACWACGWSSQARNAHGNAARHHDATGHPVRVDIQRTTTYGDPTAGAPGQETLMDQIDQADRRAVAA